MQGGKVLEILAFSENCVNGKHFMMPIMSYSSSR